MSLRHTRLLRIANMLERGEREACHRLVRWRERNYDPAHLEREGFRINVRNAVGREHPHWDRRWRPSPRLDAKENPRWRNSVGRRLRRMYFSPMARGVTTFYSQAQMQRLLALTMPRDLNTPARRLTFEEFQKVWIR